MRTVTLQLISKQDVEALVKERVKTEFEYVYAQMEKQRERQADLEILLKHFIGKDGKKSL